MKTLFAIRHAKSSWDDVCLNDHDRPLNDRGLLDAPRMADALKQRGISPDAVLSSTANRARTTAKMISAELGFQANDIELNSDWYLAPAAKWLSAVQQIDESKQVAMIFGHNPGMHQFAEEMQRQGASLQRFPTLSVAHLQFDLDYWGELDWRTGRLVEFLYPKGLPSPS